MILLHLPLNELLIAQRVSTYWKDCVRQSKKIQQALYLCPLGNHLVKAVQSSFQSPSTFLNGYWTTSERGGNDNVIRPILNPVMPRYFFTWFNRFVSILNMGFVTPIFERAAYAHVQAEHLPRPDPEALGPRNRAELRALHRSHASWKDMFLMQPPCREISILCRHKFKLFKITNPQGVTLQDLRSGLWNHWADCPLCTDMTVVPRWDFVGSDFDNVQLLRGMPSSAELLDCLERPETARLRGVLEN